MNTKEIQNARIALQNAGAPSDEKQLRATLIAKLAKDLETLRNSKGTIRKDYKRRLEAWETREVPDDVPVCAVPGDRYDCRLYRVTAIFALLGEMGLAAWVFNALGVAWWLGGLAALVITMTLHGAFLQMFDSPGRPKETLHRIKRVLLLPSIIGFLVALAFGMLARYVYGSLALALLPLFSAALWLGTLSLLVLASALFTLAHIRAWSIRLEKACRTFDTEEWATSAFLAELRCEEGGESRMSSSAQSEQTFEPIAALSSRTSGDGRGSNALGAIVLLALALSMNACATAVPTEVASAEAAKLQAHPAVLHIMIDWSGSTVRSALEEAWKTVETEMPAVIEEHRIGELTISSFDEDGWCPVTLANIAVPVLDTPKPNAKGASEWESFKNIRDAMRQAEETEWLLQTRAAQRRYRQAVSEILSRLESLQVLPEPSRETKRSDMVGLFKRISETHDARPQFVIVLTDLADTQHKDLPRIPEPKGQVQVLVLFVPAQPRDALLTTGKALSGPEQFELRMHQLRQSAPWIALAPHFARNFVALLKPQAVGQATP